MRHLILGIAAGLALAAPAAADDLDRILGEGVVRAGVCLTAEPMGYRDSDANPRGYDVDVATLLAEALGVRLELVETTVATRIADLSAGRIDVIVCNITATAERARQIDFSFPYLRTAIKVLVARSAGVATLDRLEPTSRIIVSRGTTGEALVRSRFPKAELLFAETPGDAVLLMRQGGAEAYVEDGLVIDTVARERADMFVALDETLSMDAVAFGIRKGNANLLRWLDLFASTYVSSGRYAEVYRRWWDEPPPPIAPVW